MTAASGVRINLADVKARVISRYVLETQIADVVPGSWYHVAVGPYRKGGKNVLVLRMCANEPFGQDLFIRMTNEAGGIITVRKTDVLCPVAGYPATRAGVFQRDSDRAALRKVSR